MKKAPLLITGGILLLIAGSYFLYDTFFTKRVVNPWDLVPGDAILVYEKNTCNDCVSEIGKSSVFRILDKASFFERKLDDSLHSRIGAALMNNRGVLISVHGTKKDEFDFIFYLPSTSGAWLRSYPNLSNREFNSIRIEELRLQGQAISFAQIENVLVVSGTPFLVEDVIRTYKDKDHIGFRKIHPDLQSLTRVNDDAGNVYLNYKGVSELLNLFLSGDAPNLQLATTGLLDVTTREKSLVLNGFTIDSAADSRNLLSVLRGQSPVPFGLKNFISNRVVAVCSYGISNGTSFEANLKTYRRQKNPRSLDSLTRLASTSKMDLPKLFGTISDEFAVCQLETSGRRLTKLLILETRDVNAWKETFLGLAEKFSADTVFYERYSDYEIRDIPVDRFSELMFWPFAKGFKENFYTVIGRHVLISDNLEELKNFLDDIDQDDVWGKSVSQNKFLESTLLESNLSIYLNTSRSWNLLRRRLSPKWQRFVTENRTLLSSVDMGSIQFSHLNNMFYSNLTFQYGDPLPDNKSGSSPAVITNFERGIHNLYAVRSHVTRAQEILIQDSLNDLSLIGSDGKILWKLAIGDKIVSDVNQVDFFRNGKLQYFFATTDAIHVIDRLGNYVDPYPLYTPKVRIDFVSIIDYDNSRNYRFLVADETGKLWMFDKDGRNLDGWKPNDVATPLAMPPLHHRIKGKDYISAIGKNGIIHLFNRRGEYLRGFPLKADSKPSGDYFVERGSSLNDSYYVVVSEDGFRIKVNPLGKIATRETLPKNSINSIFSLIAEKSNKSYLILQQDGKLLTLNDEEGKNVVTADMGFVAPDDVTFYDFDGGKVFITIADRRQGVCYVFDGQGNLLTSPPLSASAIEIRPVNSHEFAVFFIRNKSLIIQPL